MRVRRECVTRSRTAPVCLLSRDRNRHFRFDITLSAQKCGKRKRQTAEEPAACLVFSKSLVFQNVVKLLDKRRYLSPTPFHTLEREKAYRDRSAPQLIYSLFLSVLR